MIEVQERVNKKFNHEWKPQSVSTFLTRLVKKGWLNAYKKGKVYYYQPIFSKDEYDTKLFEDVLETSFGGNLDALKKAAMKFCIGHGDESFNVSD